MTPVSKKPFYKTLFLYKVGIYLLAPLIDTIKFALLQKQYNHHSFDKTFSWDWANIPFNRIAVIALLVGKKPNCQYLEIGCAKNTLFDSVPTLNKVGVDPERGGTVRDTSDAFFLTNKAKFDVIFIDGLHTYQQVRQDVINALKALSPGGWIALHDMLPRTWIEHHVPVITNKAWTGDVWKVAFELAQTEGIEFKILKIDQGVGVLRLTQDNPTLKDLRKELTNEQFSYFYTHVEKLPTIEWNEGQAWMLSTPL